MNSSVVPNTYTVFEFSSYNLAETILQFFKVISATSEKYHIFADDNVIK